MDSDTLGDYGETKFKDWAIKAEFSVNESIKDVTGWDFIIEPKKLIINEDKQNINPEISAMHYTIGIQVKTSYDKTNWYIDLKHMHRKISETRPEFFCFILINPQNDEVDKVYLVHVWEEQMIDTFKKVRELKQKGETENKKKVLIKSKDTDELSKPYHSSLATAIYKCIEDIENYSNRKKDLRNTLGYEDGIKSINVSAIIDKEDSVSNFFLGHKTTIELKNVEIKDDRFGIELVEKYDTLNMGFIDNKNQNTNIILGNINSSNNIEAKIPIYGYKNKTRFAHDLFEININFNIEQNSMNISLTTKQNIKALYLVHKALMENPQLTIIKDNKPMFLTIIPNDLYNNQFMEDFNYISQVYEILKKANFLEIATDINIILNQKEHIEMIHQFYISDRLINTPFMFDREKIQSTGNYIIPLESAIQLTDKNLIVVIFTVKFNTKDVSDVFGDTQDKKSSIWLTKDNYQVFDMQCITLNEYQNYISGYKELLKKKYIDHTIIS